MLALLPSIGRIFATIIHTQSLLTGVRALVSFFTFFLSSDEEGMRLLVLVFISISFYSTETLILCRTAVFKLWSMRVEEAITFGLFLIESMAIMLFTLSGFNFHCIFLTRTFVGSCIFTSIFF